MLTLLRMVSSWPLALLQALGAVVGWLTWLGSPTYRKRIAEHARLAGYDFAQIRASVGHAGRMSLETPRLWLGRPVPVQWPANSMLMDEAYAAGKGIVFLSPHLGCFEIVGQAITERYRSRYGSATVLYRPARHPWLAPVVEASRQRDGLDMVPTTMAGVRQLLKTLRAGRAVGLLPDQVPPQGQGVWAPFFGRDAYTMTLAARLIHQTGATPLLVWGERLPAGAGFRLHMEAFPEPLSADLDTAVAQINRALEGLIRQCPEQYLWGYGRYKTPRPEP